MGTGGDRLRVGVIGASGRGNYGHLLDRAFENEKDAVVVAVTDLESAAEAADRAGALGAARSYTDHREMLERDAPDIVVVATRHVDRHEQLVLDAIGAGAHVLCEKPLARDLREADRMVDAAEAAGVRLANALPWRNEARSRIVADLMATPEFGELVELSAVCKCDPRGGGEDFLILGLHFADMMRALAGDPVRCRARVHQDGRPIVRSDARPGGEHIGPVAGDHVRSGYEFSGGLPGSITSVRAGITDRAQHPYRLFVHGTRGIISIRAPYADNSVWFHPEPALRPDGPSWQRVDTTQARTYADYHHPAAADLVDAVRNGRPPHCSGDDGRRALEMILAAYASALRDAPVELPLVERGHPLA